MPSGDVLEEALFTASLLIKPAGTLYKALKADRRRTQPSLWVDGVTEKIKAVGSFADKTAAVIKEPLIKYSHDAKPVATR